MRKSIVAMLVAIAGLLVWNSANAGEVLWSYTDNTDWYINPDDAESTVGVTRTGWFPLINSVYSGERGAKGQDYVFDSLYVTITAGPALATDDSVDFTVHIQTSEDKSTTSSDTVLIATIAGTKVTAGTYKLFGGSLSRYAFAAGDVAGNPPLARYGRLLFSRATEASPSTSGADSVLVTSYTIRAVGTSR